MGRSASHQPEMKVLERERSFEGLLGDDSGFTGGQSLPADAVSRMRRRVLRVNVFGWVLIAAGLLAVISGYLGVRNEIDVSVQIPYLLSGGIGGLLLAMVGVTILLLHDIGTVRAGLRDLAARTSGPDLSSERVTGR